MGIHEQASQLLMCIRPELYEVKKTENLNTSTADWYVRYGTIIKGTKNERTLVSAGFVLGHISRD